MLLLLCHIILVKRKAILKLAVLISCCVSGNFPRQRSTFICFKTPNDFYPNVSKAQVVLLKASQKVAAKHILVK